MNLSKPLNSASRLLHNLFLRCRLLLPRQRCLAFSGGSDIRRKSGIGRIYVVNLDREQNRWTKMLRELSHILDASRQPLSDCTVRYSACDAQSEHSDFQKETEVDPFYTLGDQLFVEPQPRAVPNAFDLLRKIRMTRAEIAVAHSHISVWRTIAQSSDSYALVLEDDVWFERSFGRILDQAWDEMTIADQGEPKFDILYLSYKEVLHGAAKELISKNLFRPSRGLWYMSGYVLSKKGAVALLNLLPCRGPIDLWINHKFRDLDVRALRRSVVPQRSDLLSSNSYSILPILSKIGVIDSGAASLFHQRPILSPVFVFGTQGSGLSSIAMALSMLGYRCCSDYYEIPASETNKLRTGRTDRIFDAYVNIGSLEQHIPVLIKRYPHAKYFVVSDSARLAENQNVTLLDALDGADVVHAQREDLNSWRFLCENLKLAPPDAPYPDVKDVGQRKYNQTSLVQSPSLSSSSKWLRHDPSPWIAKPHAGWSGIHWSMIQGQESLDSCHVSFEDDFVNIRPNFWLLRNDTFPGNLGLFRPENVTGAPGGGLLLSVTEKELGVRNFSAAAISSHASFLFGRFEATLQATNVPGLVTGFFLHRNSPRQEIDVEIRGNAPRQLLVNVFYNPGTDGAKFDYGYRGTPAIIDLGFDASESPHQFAIEWDPCEIRWFVDQKLVHRRTTWAPTPIPHLPMTLHLNTWPTRSQELAGRLAIQQLPASSIIRRVAVNSYSAETHVQWRSLKNLTEGQQPARRMPTQQ